MEKFECIFCGKIISSGNVTSILITTNWEKNEEEQQSQQLFCHLECLKKAMNRPKYLYIDE